MNSQIVSTFQDELNGGVRTVNIQQDHNRIPVYSFLTPGQYKFTMINDLYVRSELMVI